MRVGIVSQHFRKHSVWDAIVRGWFRHLDRERFELYGFHVGTATDAETEFARQRARYFKQGPAELREWASALLDSALDVLVYPEVGMDPTTVQLASMRLAPVQAASWGHPETTGLPTIDYFLSAALLEPPGAADHYTERLIELPNLGCCYEPQPVAPEEPDLQAWDVEFDRPVLVCPGVPFKYAPQHDAVFTAIARKLGRCRFVFFRPTPAHPADALRERLQRVFAREHLNFDAHVSFVPWQTSTRFFGLLERATVFLDTIGFSGFNTAVQGVQCAIPIVTRNGAFMRGRLASGILERMGVRELIADSDDAYVALAVKLATDSAYCEDVRARMAESRGLLFGDLAPIRALEAFLEAVAARA